MTKLKNWIRRPLFWLGCLGLLGSLCEISRACYSWDQAAGWGVQRFRKTRIRSGTKENDLHSSIVQSAFSRDALLKDFHIGQDKFSINKFTVELVSTNTSNGIILLVNDPSNFERYLRSPKSVEDLVPALVCDYVFFCVSFGSSEAYSTLMQWRQAYVNQHPGACLLVFHNDASALTDVRKVGFAFKPWNHLYLIKAISDGRIITTAKYDELLDSGLMSRPTRGPPSLTREDTTSLKEFIRLLTPHMSSGIGIPSSADMSLYPTIFFVDLDTLFVNKSTTVPTFLQRIDGGFELQSILPSNKNETLSNDLNPAPYSSAEVDFVIATDIGCNMGVYFSLNSGVQLSRPTHIMASILMSSLDDRLLLEGRKEDQGALIAELEVLSEFNSHQFLSECQGGPRWTRPEYQNRIVFATVLSGYPNDGRGLTKAVAQLNRKRNEHMEKILGPPVEYRNGSRVPLVVIVNERWCNAMYKRKASDWNPGDWIVHFTQFTIERKHGKRLRKWICDNLDSVAHPDNWPSSPTDCPQLIEKGFSYIPNALDQVAK